MVAEKINSNKNTALFAVVKSAVVDVREMTLAELNSMLNVSDYVKWDGYDFGVEASDQDEDRVLTDAATAASRGYENFGGSIAFFPPLPTDTSSVARQVRSLVSTPHTELVLVQRDGYAADAAWDEGQVFNSFHVITDANAELRGDKNRYYTIDFKNKGFCGINRIVPTASPTGVTIGPTTPTVDVDETIQLTATYEGNNITIGAAWVSSNEAVAVVTPHGRVIGVSAGTASISATYPGSAAGTPKTVTVS